MINYFIQKRAFSGRFERYRDGYLYRRSPWSAGYLVSEAEHDRLMADFRRFYWRWWLTMILAIFEAMLLDLVIVIGLVTLLGVDSERLIPVVTPILVLPVLGLTVIYSLRGPSRLVAKAIGNREPELPARGYRRSRIEAAHQRSWPKHFAALPCCS